MPISLKDKTTIRDLARRVAEIGHNPIQAANREAWKRHNSLQRGRPMVLAFPEGAWTELLPHSALECQDQALHGWEWHLRHLIYRWEHLRDDNVIEPRIRIGAVYHCTGWGVEIKHRDSTMPRGAWAFEPVIKDESDLAKLQKPTIELDEDATRRNLDYTRELFGDTLPVVLRRALGFDNRLLQTVCMLVGMDNLMMALVDKPEFVHAAMSFMTDATLELMESCEKRGYIRPNNEDDYVGSGGVAYTTELPSTGSDENGFTLMDCWGFAEAQEFALVSPAMHEEFVLQYQRRMLAKYGLNCYGCCEALDNKFDIVFKIPRLRRLSISAWADIRKSADALGDRCIFSWKPNPADLAGESFNPDLIRAKIEECVSVAKDCVLEIIMKDTHTIRNEPHRLSEWVRIAKEVTSYE